MKYKKIVLTVIIFVIGSIAIQWFKNAQSEEIPAVALKPLEKVWTRMDTLIHAYDSLIMQQLEEAGTIGAAMVVVYNGEVVLLKCFGERQKGSGDPVNQHTVFRLASVSKTFTGMLAAKLSLQNKVPLNSKVIDYVPSFRLKDTVNTFRLEISHLLSHTTGLVPYAYDNLVESGWSLKMIMDSLYRVDINGPPGTYYSYQNVAFSLYDTISELATGKSFDLLMKKEIFDPLGMRDASVGLEPFKERKNKAWPHVGSKGNFRATKENLRYYNTNPAAGVNISIDDMASYLLALTGHQTKSIDTIIINEIITPRIPTPLRWNYLRNWKKVESKEYGLGWRVIGAYGNQIAYHGGYVEGYRAEIAFCRDEDFGIALLSNSPNGVESGIIPLFLDLYFGE